MNEPVMCPCGETEYHSGLSFTWQWNDCFIAALRNGSYQSPLNMGDYQQVGYCPSCGARLGFDAEGNPTVEPRVEWITDGRNPSRSDNYLAWTTLGYMVMWFEGEWIDGLVKKPIAWRRLPNPPNGGISNEHKPVEPRVEGPEIGTFAWAVERMRKGKRVRRAHWSSKHFVFIDHFGFMLRNDGSYYQFDIAEYDADNWEVVN